MYFNRIFKNGAGDYNPLQKTFAEYVCDNCNWKEWIEIKCGTVIDKTKIIVCPECKSFGKQDHINNIKKQIEELTKNKSNIEVQIEKLTEEMNKITSTQETPHENHN